MRDFITGLQFLTTIRLWPETEWSAERFGRSVRYFPIIGAIIGIILAGAQQLILSWLPGHISAALLVIGGILLTGGLHCDGFMDTADGLLSGRSRERMLEIMKDSRVGANGVVAFVCLVLLKWSIFLDLSAAFLPIALFAAPIAGRVAMTTAITRFPYARPEGLGKGFAQYSATNDFLLAIISGLILVSLAGWIAVTGALLGIAAGLLFARSACRTLGGLTGDLYGAVTELTELCTIGSILIVMKWSIV